MNYSNCKFSTKSLLKYILTVLGFFVFIECSNEPDLIEHKDPNGEEEEYPDNLELGKGSTSPLMKGTFVTFWNKANWNSIDWESHMKEMHEIGIKTLVVQFTAYENNIWTESSNTYSTVKYPRVLGLLLDAAEKYNMGVFVGLYFSENYWQNATDSPTINIHTQRSKEIASEIWEAHKSKDSFKGWYISHEPASYYYRTSEDFKFLKNQLINPIADHCKSLSGKPVSIAPFFNYKLTDVDTFSSFMTSLGSSNIDLIILQDGIGVFHCDLESLESYFAAANKSLYEIGDFKGAFWADIETFKFTDTVTETMNPESIEVIVKKLSIVAPHVSNIVTFQYYNDMCAKNPNGKLAEKLRNDYIKYLK